jgi:hypothetical protein
MQLRTSKFNYLISTFNSLISKFNSLISKFNSLIETSLLSISSHFSTHGSQVRCKLANYVSKFKNWARTSTKFASTSQYLNYCKQMFIVQVEINNSMESSWSSGLPRRFVFHWIGYYYRVWTFVYKRSSNIEMNLRTLLRSSRPIFKLGNVIGKFATNPRTARWKVTWNRQ